MRRFVHFIRDLVSRATVAWCQFWFQPTPTTTLDLIRIGLGAAIFIHYAIATPYLFFFWGDSGMMPREIAMQYLVNPWIQSVFFYFDAPWQWIAFHGFFLFCCGAFTVGWRTAWVKWIVLIGQVSYDHRNLAIPYGVDIILACLLLILCIAPIGRAMSLDRARAVRAVKLKQLDATLPRYTSPLASACTRLMQIQMAVLFFYSALSKRADDWFDGDAIWLVLTTNEYYNYFIVDLLARHYWLVNLATFATITIEISYPFLIWQQRTRPYLLTAAIFLHLQFAVFLGLFYFAFVMIMGHASFVRPEWLSVVGAKWKSWLGDMELAYDSRNQRCIRALAWLLAFDGLNQIRVRDRCADTSTVATTAQDALILSPAHGPPLSGFAAYHYLILRVPGLWWLVPLVTIPVLSHAIGSAIHRRMTKQAI